MMGELYQYRELLYSLTLRDVRVRYKQSLLGAAWALFVPLSMMLIFTFVFTRALKVDGRLDLGGMPYPVFAYIGLLPWTFFSGSLTAAVNSLVANRALVTKVYCPREAFPLASVASSAFDFGVAALLLGGIIAYFHCFTEWDFTLHATVLAVPLVFAVQVLLTVGLALLLAMANLFYRDVRYVFSVGIYLWMFLTCVIYPLEGSEPWHRLLINLNPMTPIIAGYRDCIIHGRLPAAGPFLYAAGVAVLACVGGWRIFHKAEPRFAEFV